MSNIEDIIRNPVSWVAGGIASVVGVLTAVGGDPISSTIAVLTVLSANATEAFTAASILGFTVAPEIPQLPEGALKAIALVFGVLVVLKMLSGLWDAITGRLGGA